MSLFSWLFGKKPTVAAKQSRTSAASPSAPQQKPALSSPIQPIIQGPFRFVALDVETANSDPSSICQIGIAGVKEDGSILTWASFINPKCSFDIGNTAIHGITPSTINGAPSFETALGMLSQLLCDHTVFQHSNFDRQAIESACDRCGLPRPQFTWADSVRVAQKAWPDLKGNGGHGLASLKKHLDLNFNHHDAEHDARASAEIVLRAEADTGLHFSELLSPTTKKRSYPTPITAEGAPAGSLVGEVAVFTGSLSLRRDEAAELAAVAGITTAANVTRKTTLLIIGDQDLSLLAGHEKSSKHRKAEELIAKGQNIRIIGETDFLSLVGALSPKISVPSFDIRKHLKDHRRWQQSKKLILDEASASPEQLFAAAQEISGAFTDLVENYPLSYKDAVIISREIEEMADAMTDHADEADLSEDPKFEVFEIARKTMDAIDEAAGEFLIIKSGVQDRQSK